MALLAGVVVVGAGEAGAVLFGDGVAGAIELGLELLGEEVVPVPDDEAGQPVL